MNRPEIRTLTQLIESADAGGYTLPRELLDAHRTYARAREIKAPEAQPFAADQAAARMVAALATEPVDPADLIEEAAHAEAQTRAAGQVQRSVTLAVEMAAGVAINAASDLTEHIITAHLRPALEKLYDEVREAAAALDGYRVDDPHRIITAPAKVRNAYGSLPALVARRRAIMAARKHANAVGNRKPQHDAAYLFGEFRNPLAFHPHWKPPAQVPRIPYPEDATERLLWIVSDKAAPAQPWLPTVAEQDEAWWSQFGEAQEWRAKSALSARAYAGQRV